jgi:hypothetical protein
MQSQLNQMDSLVAAVNVSGIIANLTLLNASLAAAVIPASTINAMSALGSALDALNTNLYRVVGAVGLYQPDYYRLAQGYCNSTATDQYCDTNANCTNAPGTTCVGYGTPRCSIIPQANSSSPPVPCSDDTDCPPGFGQCLANNRTGEVCRT